MPEEINRMVTDSISDYFFVTEASGVNNLLREGKPKDRIHFVGNVMIDNLLYQAGKLKKDDGKGFYVKERELALDKEKRLGIRSMKERVNLLGGQMTIHSRLMEGTKIFIKYPIHIKNV